MRIFSNIKWWFFHRFHPSHRYNLVKTGLSPGYYDKDMLMEHAIAQLVITFFEEENPLEHWRDTKQYDELVSIYDFFKTYKKENFEAVDRDELTRKLVRVVELRGLMWT